MRDRTAPSQDEQQVEIEFDSITLAGSLVVPSGTPGVVLFAHGSGSGWHSPRNRYVARELQQAGLATLLLDLLTEDEEAIDAQTRHLRFDIGLLAERLAGATDWLTHDARTRSLNIGYFGASTGREPRCWRRPSDRRWSAPSSRAADAPTWPAMPWRVCWPRRC